MSLFVMYLGTRYDVYGFNVLRDITICLFYVTFELRLWPLAFVKVTSRHIDFCHEMYLMFVPKMKFVGSVEFEIWTKRYKVGKLTEIYEERMGIMSL